MQITIDYYCTRPLMRVTQMYIRQENQITSIHIYIFNASQRKNTSCISQNKFPRANFSRKREMFVLSCSRQGQKCSKYYLSLNQLLCQRLSKKIGDRVHRGIPGGSVVGWGGGWYVSIIPNAEIIHDGMKRSNLSPRRCFVALKKG